MSTLPHVRTVPSPRRAAPAIDHPYGPGWSLLLWPPLAIALCLLVVPQALFVAMSFYRNLGMGQIADTFTIENYTRILSDGYYLGSIWLTIYLSACATVIGVAFAFPTAYLLARMRSKWVSYLVILLLVSSFVTVVIKVLGLTLLIEQEGLVNRLLRSIGLIDQSLALTNNRVGVLIGLVQYTLPLIVMLLFSALQTIPRSLEDAAEIHGASWLSTLRRVVLPLAKPGLVGATLIAFNMCMGAFTSAVLLGGGRILTLPVLIQRKIVLDADYPVGAALSTLLLLLVVLLNLFFVALLKLSARRTPLRRTA